MAVGRAQAARSAAGRRGAGRPSPRNPRRAVSAAERIDLERALGCLSDGERAAIAACYYADLTHEEAAEAIGIPLGTVKTHILRAKAKLRAKLAEDSR